MSGRRGPSGRPLSPRQLDALRRVAAGQTHKEIARDLDIDVGSVGTLFREIFRKLGAVSAPHAVHIAHEQRLMTERPDCTDRAAYLRHLRRGEPACWRCLAANADHEADRRAARGNKPTAAAA